MELKKSSRKQLKLRIGISGASGFGKTKSALLLAHGITEDWSKIAVIDSEQSSSSCYSDLGEFNVVELNAPYSPERFIQAIELCEKSGMEVCIIDSISMEWSGTGGCLEIHEKLGGRFQDWAVVTPRHQAFIDKILNSTCHIITTARRKTDYSLDVGSNGKTKVVKHGMKEITREGYEYELTVNFELINDKNLCKVSKDRSGLWMNRPEFIITQETGKELLRWANSGIPTPKNTLSSEDLEIEELSAKISQADSIATLLALYKQYPEHQEVLKSKYEEQKRKLLNKPNPNTFSKNGHHV